MSIACLRLFTVLPLRPLLRVPPVGEMLCEAVDLRSNQRVLDVAAGNGNATLAAARRFADVVSTDYVGALLERGRERAKADRLPVTFQEADAEALPFADASFDVVLSTFGVMFAPNQQQAANELIRVCRPGGKIGLANWTPESFIGKLFKTIGKYVPPAPGTDESRLQYQTSTVPAPHRVRMIDNRRHQRLLTSLRQNLVRKPFKTVRSC
jgi:ubiquinone/menaquinone biosynthesis C-methylase UbiE